MFKDFPHNDSKTITMINVQEDYIVEHMGGSMPRIYTALYNWQVEHQAQMIEVEGMINQLIEILIESGTSHIYIGLNLAKRFSLKKASIVGIGQCIQLQGKNEGL